MLTSPYIAKHDHIPEYDYISEGVTHAHMYTYIHMYVRMSIASLIQKSLVQQTDISFHSITYNNGMQVTYKCYFHFITFTIIYIHVSIVRDRVFLAPLNQFQLETSSPSIHFGY